MKKMFTLALLAVLFTGAAQSAFAAPTICKKIDGHVVCKEPHGGRL